MDELEARRERRRLLDAAADAGETYVEVDQVLYQHVAGTWLRIYTQVGADVCNQFGQDTGSIR